MQFLLNGRLLPWHQLHHHFVSRRLGAVQSTNIEQCLFRPILVHAENFLQLFANRPLTVLMANDLVLLQPDTSSYFFQSTPVRPMRGHNCLPPSDLRSVFTCCSVDACRGPFRLAKYFLDSSILSANLFSRG